jgi:hypothetical protein
MHGGCARKRCVIVAVAGVLLALAGPAFAEPRLRKLECVSIQTAVLESGASLGITTELLREAILSGVKAKVPQLNIEPTCADRIFFKVFVQELSSETFQGFYGHVALEVRRQAKFKKTGEPIDGRAWDLESYIHGTRDRAKSSVLDQLNSHLTQFAADYKSSNP